jgi:hypothetical protein
MFGKHMARVMSFDKLGTALRANLGRTLFGRDAHLNKLRPNATHRVREPPVKGELVPPPSTISRKRFGTEEPAGEGAPSADWLNRSAAPLEMPRVLVFPRLPALGTGPKIKASSKVDFIERDDVSRPDSRSLAVVPGSFLVSQV